MDFIDFFLHLDIHLANLVTEFGFGTYAVLFAVVFCETGLVFTPFLPGDSLIFVAATLAAQDVLNVFSLYLVFLIAAILGDTINYWIGHFLGKKIVREKGLIRDEHLDRTREFYDKYGKKTIVMARFIPIVRTFAPFVAGMSRMDYKIFSFYNVLGGFLWVTLFTLAGYFFGELPWVQENLHYLILLIIGVSILPPVFEYAKAKWKRK